MVVDDAEITRLYRSQTPSSAPAYQRVKDLIADQITTGHWAAGDLLPSENQLVSALHLSRMTVNRALRELSADGLVVRTMGVGSFVAERKTSSALFRIRNIADEVVQRGHLHRAQVVALRPQPADPVLAEQFGIRRGTDVFYSRIVHFEDDAAIQLEDRYVDPTIAPDYLKQDFTTSTPYSYLMSVARLGRGQHIVEAVLADEPDCRLLDIDTSQPCLLIHRRTWSDGRLVSIARLLHPGSTYRLEGTFDVG